MTRNDNRKRLLWHVEVEDYFGTLATVLDLLRQRLEQRGYEQQHATLLKEVREDLLHLQDAYRIVRRRRPAKSHNGRF